MFDKPIPYEPDGKSIVDIINEAIEMWDIIYHPYTEIVDTFYYENLMKWNDFRREKEHARNLIK